MSEQTHTGTACVGNGNCKNCGKCLNGERKKQIYSAGAPKADAHAGRQQTGYDIAVDIGTTTIAMALVDDTESIVRTLTKNNSQRAFGADVLSRIRYANSGGAKELQQVLWRDILNGIEELRSPADDCSVRNLLISGNTTMEHLLMGDSCEHLGTAPFTPANLKHRELRLSEVLGEVPAYCKYTKLIVLPGISAFVGADIVMGMYACGMNERQKKENILFIDLGTNGEMVLKTADGYLATSVAAGPAFEGVNITCGCPSIEGAICGVSMMGKRMIVKTIGDEPPAGICGTGVTELAYEMIKTGMADNNGTFAADIQVNGLPVASTKAGRPIIFTQSDMRQLQLAKAAVRAGIELLMKEKRLSAAELDSVCLAGGFGYQMNIYKAAGIGLLPKELRGRTRAMGNTSIQGVLRYLKEKNAAGHLQEMIAAATEINLAEHPAFEQTYLGYMKF